jgi:bla regulator protein blaR1
MAITIYMVAETLFWFYPLVRWIGIRLIEERERACDEEVLRLGHEPGIYAEGILKVCQGYVEAPTHCASGVTGSDLKKRIRAILAGRIQCDLNLAKKALLATAAIAALGMPIAVGMLHSPLLAQSQPQMPEWQKAAGGQMSFEVSSVRPSEEMNIGRFPLNADNLYRPTGGLFEASLPVRVYIEFAYKLRPEDLKDALARLPKWVDTDNYAIRAKAPTTSPTKDQMRLMIQSLLAERFKLQARFEMREVPAYALTLINAGKLGTEIRLHADGPPCPTNQGEERPFGYDPNVWPPTCGAINAAPAGMPIVNPLVKKKAVQNILMAARNISMETLIARLPGYAGRPVLDKTGLRAPIDFRLEWTPEPGQPLELPQREPTTNDVFDYISLQQALKEQLGMKLEATRAPVSFLRIDHVERPAEN